MATYFDIEKKEFCEALETFLREQFKENYIGKCASGTFINKIGENEKSHFPVYFTIQVVEKNSDYLDKHYKVYTVEEYKALPQKFKVIYRPFDGEGEVAEYEERQREIQREKKERVWKLLSALALTKEEKKEFLKAFLDDIQNETEED